MKKCILFIAIAAIVTVNGCTGEKPLFDELSGSRLTVIIKGTFESTSNSASVKGWDTAVTSSPSVSNNAIDDSVNDFITDSSEQFPTTFMVDIAEIRLAKPDGSSDDKVGNYRQVFTSQIDDSDPFFNGQGVRLKCDDVKPGKQYSTVKLYIRKLIFDNATQWHIDATNTVVQDSDPQVIFHEKTVNGFDFNQLMVNTYYDYLKENYQDINRVFPLVIPIDGGLLVNEDEEVVLEIRLVIKNFIKLYEYDFTNDNGYGAAYHYWAPSDWLRDVHPDDVYIGGNLLGVARVYRKDTVATVSGTTASSGYVIAIPATDVYDNPQTIADYFLDDGNAGWTRPATYNTNYEFVWNTYDGYKWSLRLPPLVAHSNGSYTMTNVPYGEYLFYFIADNDIPFTGENKPYGKLPQRLSNFLVYDPDDPSNPKPFDPNNPVNFKDINGDTIIEF